MRELVPEIGRLICAINKRRPMTALMARDTAIAVAAPMTTLTAFYPNPNLNINTLDK